jgi:hypothetical protein
MREFGKTPRHSWFKAIINFIWDSFFQSRWLGGHRERMEARKRKSMFRR